MLKYVLMGLVCFTSQINAQDNSTTSSANSTAEFNSTSLNSTLALNSTNATAVDTVPNITLDFESTGGKPVLLRDDWYKYYYNYY